MNGWSAEALADMSHDPAITRDVIANIEYGRRKDVGVMQLWAIARALRVPLVALLVPLDDPSGTVSVGDREVGVMDALSAEQAWVQSRQPPSADQAFAQLAALRTYRRLLATIEISSEELIGFEVHDAADIAMRKRLEESWESDRQALEDHIVVMRALGIEVPDLG